MKGPRQIIIHDQPVELVDIWSRPGKWARQRAYIFLAVNLAVYAGLNVFVYWIQNARQFEFSWASYTATFHKTLIDLLPMSVREAPVLIPILGVLLAVIVIVPILISQLYGFRFAIIFAACVLILAHLPVLSLFLVACSFIAGSSRHWLPFKFGVALLSLLPIAIYFYVATRGGQMAQLRSIDQTLLYAPWVFAFLAAAVIAAAVLAFAKLVEYRPGGILISMITLSAVPAVLFHAYIGADQLEFRILAHKFNPQTVTGSASVDIRPILLERTLKNLERSNIRNLDDILETTSQTVRSAVQNLAHQQSQQLRVRIIDACRQFRAKYPSSRFMPNQLYLFGLAQDMRFDQSILRSECRVQYHTDLVSPTSRDVWQELINDFPESVYALPARYRLAILQLRKQDTTQAMRLIAELLERLPKFMQSRHDKSPTPTTLRELFARPSRTDVPAIDLETLEQQAENLLELIQYNADDPKFGNEPLAEFFKLDTHHPKWQSNLLDLAIKKYQRSKLYNNLLVMAALAGADPQKLRADLKRYTEIFKKGDDARATALFQLARLTQSFARVSIDGQGKTQARKRAVELYRQLIDEYPNYSLAKRASASLASLDNTDRTEKK